MVFSELGERIYTEGSRTVIKKNYNLLSLSTN